jgi:hypothetical protein
MTQFWAEGVPIAVEANDNAPVAFCWQQRWRRVQTVVEQWVIHDEWWRDEVWRRYFQIETGDALLCVLYHDLLTDAWFLERIYD